MSVSSFVLRFCVTAFIFAMRTSDFGQVCGEFVTKGNFTTETSKIATPVDSVPTEPSADRESTMVSSNQTRWKQAFSGFGSPKPLASAGFGSPKPLASTWFSSTKSPSSSGFGSTKPGNTTTEFDEMDAERLATARLKSYLRNLPTSLEKIPPTVKDKDGHKMVQLEAIVSVLSVVGVDDAQQTVKTGLYFLFRWQDKALAWNTSQFHGVEKVVMPADFAWTPSISVVNSREPTDMFQVADNLVVHSDGNIMAHVPVFVETFCSLDLTYYPFDEQECPILIFSFVDVLEWTVEFSMEGSRIIADALKIGSEWEMLNTSIQNDRLAGGISPSPQIWLRLRRKRTFYTVCLVLPMALTSYMNTLVFLLPLQAGEKVSFLVSIYVSTSVFVSYFTTVMPRGLNSVPITMKLLIGVIVESLLVLLATIAVLRRHNRQQKHRNHQNISQFHPSNTMNKKTSKLRPLNVHPSNKMDNQTSTPSPQNESDRDVQKESKPNEMGNFSPNVESRLLQNSPDCVTSGLVLVNQTRWKFVSNGFGSPRLNSDTQTRISCPSNHVNPQRMNVGPSYTPSDQILKDDLNPGYPFDDRTVNRDGRPDEFKEQFDSGLGSNKFVSHVINELTAEFLDQLLFALFFIGNTFFLAILFSQSLAAEEVGKGSSV